MRNRRIWRAQDLRRKLGLTDVEKLPETTIEDEKTSDALLTHLPKETQASRNTQAKALR